MSEASGEPSAIVDQMLTLTEIEGDLAETALAVSASAPTDAQPDAQSAPAPGQGAEVADGQDDGDRSAAEALLDNAEASERVLEDAIPDPPSDAVASAASASASASAPVAEQESATEQDAAAAPTSTQDNVSQSAPVPTESTPAALADPAPTPTPSSTTTAAADAQQAIQSVEADLNNPILPAQAAEPAHDVAMETANEEDTGKIQVEVEETTVDNVAEAVANGEGTQQQPPVGPSTSTPIPEPAPVPQSIPSAAPAQEPESHDSDFVFPAGLSANSPSILANPGLFSAWTRDPSPETALRLFTWAVQKTEIADARAWYALLAESEPTAVQPLLALINLELALSNFEQVEALFAKALKGPSGGITAAADVSVWKAYLHYIRRQNPIPDVNPDSVRSIITNAYDFALKECGTDRESGEIWQEYIAFIGQPKPTNTWDSQQQMDTLRRTYQRAVCIPLNNVEVLWKQYDAFESGLNKLTAKKFLAERSPAYMTARTALRELGQLTDSLPRPPLPPHPTFSELDRRTVNAWKAYIKWEEGNPLVIEDQEALSSRIGYALRKCLGEMRHFPELWHYAANYYATAGKIDVAAEVLAAGVQACPSSALLTFALADTEEDRRNLARVHEVYTALLDRLNPEIEQLQQKVAAEVEAAKGPEIQQNTGDVDMTGDGLSEIQKAVEQREARGKAVAERRGRDVADLAAAAGVVWVMYMRFARRAEGIKAARGIFGKARKSPHPTWHIFEASAMMEYHANKDSAVAIRIFELGFKLFADDVEYVVRYLQFLLSINDDTNARALFERSAAKIAPENARPLWDTWARYEYMYGDLSAVHKLEARFAETFPKDSPLKRFAQRFTYNGLDQIALRDLGFGLRQNLPPPAPVSGVPPPNVVPTLAPTQPVPIPAPTLPISQPIAPIANSPPAPPKRALPDSPRAPGQGPPPGRSNSPSYKRPRGQSPPRQFNRVPSGSQPPVGPPPRNFRDRTSRDRESPMNRGSVPPVVPPGARVGTPDRDRSGVSRPLAWFISTLPSARSFDGPVFRPDDIMGLFSNIARDGTGIKGPAPGYGAPPSRNGPVHPVQGYTPPIQNRPGSGPPQTGPPRAGPPAAGFGGGYNGPQGMPPMPPTMPPMGVPRNGGYNDRYGGPPRRY